jgi:selenophosphate synthase
MSDEFWNNLDQYRELGLDAPRWIASSSDELESLTILDSFAKTKRSNHLTDYSWFDVFPYSGKNPEIVRRVYNFKDFDNANILKNKRIVSLFNVHADTLCDSPALLKMLTNFCAKINPKYRVKCVGISTTSHRESEFVLLDYIDVHRGDKIGYTAINTSSIKVIDPLEQPDSPVNVAISLTASLENLLILGCTTGFRIIPIYDAPNEDIINRIQTSHDAFASKYDIFIDDYSSIKTGKLFLGATAYAHTEKQLPVRYDLIKPGMAVLLTDKFGSLSPLNIFTMEKLEEFKPNAPNDLEDSVIKNEIIKSLTQPKFSLGKIIAKYSSELGNEFDISTNLVAVHPAGIDGALSLLHLARISNSHLKIREIPMKYEEFAVRATTENIIPNSTSSANGCHIIIASNEVANQIAEDLKKHNFDATIIGEVIEKDGAKVTISKKLRSYMAADRLINRFELSDSI